MKIDTQPNTPLTAGDTANSSDVNLLTDPFRTEFTSHLDTTAVASLPEMHGSGQVRSLRGAASVSPALATLLTQFASATTRSAQMALMDGILQEWSNTSTMATTFTGAYAGHALTVNIQSASGAAYTAWAEKLTLFEHFNGRTFNAVPAPRDKCCSNESGYLRTILRGPRQYEESDGKTPITLSSYLLHQRCSVICCGLIRIQNASMVRGAIQ